MFEENIAAPSHPQANECSRRRSIPSGNAESNDASRFENLKVIKLLNKAKFSVYLTGSQTTNQQYAMKAFPLDNERPHRYFQNEIRFACLDHNNVIKIEHVENKKKVIHKGCQVEMSYILMEYAPYGDFYDLVSDDRMKTDTKLVRTYFRQLIHGLEYLHGQGVSHLDLKLENLLLGDNYVLKIADFDLSHQSGDKQTLARGTKCYRSPELMSGRCANFSAADIYSAGIILFIMKSGGLMPHSENTLVKGINFYELLYTDNQTFWKKHYQFQTPGQEVFEPEFKELFNLMTKYKPGERADMGQIKASQWYNGEFYTDEELACVMKSFDKS